MNFEKTIQGIIDREGGFSDHPADKGGPTRYGITERKARERGYTGDMRELPRDLATAIYTHDFIIAPGFDLVLAESKLIGEELIDTGVNMGHGLPGKWLQRILNALNQPMHSFAPLKVDGRIGPATIGALRKVIEKRGVEGERVIKRGLDGFQRVRYLELVEERPKNSTFYYGWMRTRTGD